MSACGLAIAVAARASSAPFLQVAQVSGAGLDCLRGAAERDIAVIACREVCAPIPWQLDERDAGGTLVLDTGAEPAPTEPRGVLDDNDELLWMASDAGRPARGDELPASARCRVALVTRTAAGAGHVYAVAMAAPAPRSPVRYVTYDAERDTVRGARMGLGFGAPTARTMTIAAGPAGSSPNLLDRLKVRASARLLGIIPLSRDEDDIEWRFGGWRAGPIRVVRREWQWVRLASWLRTPILQTETLAYRDWIELPVRLRLNFPPRYLLGGIAVEATLDFRDLRGWSVLAAGATPIRVGGGAPGPLVGMRSDWLALSGPDLTFLLRLRLGETLASLRTTFVHRENAGGHGPEGVPGEMPAVGFRLTDWGEVDQGHHEFAAIAYALPADYAAERFLREAGDPVVVAVEPFTNPGTAE